MELFRKAMIIIMIIMVMVMTGTVTYFTSRASATIPAASGAEAEVPVCLMVQVFLRSVVACEVKDRTSDLDLVALRYIKKIKLKPASLISSEFMKIKIFLTSPLFAL